MFLDSFGRRGQEQRRRLLSCPGLWVRRMSGCDLEEERGCRPGLGHRAASGPIIIGGRSTIGCDDRRLSSRGRVSRRRGASLLIVTHVVPQRQRSDAADKTPNGTAIAGLCGMLLSEPAAGEHSNFAWPVVRSLTDMT